MRYGEGTTHLQFHPHLDPASGDAAWIFHPHSNIPCCGRDGNAIERRAGDEVGECFLGNFILYQRD